MFVGLCEGEAIRAGNKRQPGCSGSAAAPCPPRVPHATGSLVLATHPQQQLITPSQASTAIAQVSRGVWAGVWGGALDLQRAAPSSRQPALPLPRGSWAAGLQPGLPQPPPLTPGSGAPCRSIPPCPPLDAAPAPLFMMPSCVQSSPRQPSNSHGEPAQAQPAPQRPGALAEHGRGREGEAGGLLVCWSC